MLFVDTQCNVARNEYLAQLKPNIARKVQEYLDVKLKHKCMNPGDCLFITVLIEDFKFEEVALLCINVW